MRFDWNTVGEEWSYNNTAINDVKSLVAVRRKQRSEIRRFRLMAAVTLADDDEPAGKRSKVCCSAKKRFELDLKAGATVLGTHGSPESKEQSRVPVSRVQQQDKQSTAVPTVLLSDGNTCAQSHVPSRQSVCTINEGDEGDSSVGCRLASFERNAACPSHCVVSICGRSRNMEDAAIAVPSFLSMPSSIAGQKHADTYHFYGVYDGHGGRQAADYCKERVHGALADEMSAAGNGLSSQWEACFQSCFEKLDADLCGLCPHGSDCPRKVSANGTSTGTSSSCREPLVPGSIGTTAVVAVVGPEQIVVGNCGDSRAVLCRGGHAVPLSQDHKANRPDEVARIEAAGGQVFTWEGHRVCGVLAMSRALGDGFLKPFVSGQPEVTITARNDDDECLILASDGLWDALSIEDVCAVARKALASWRRRHRSNSEQNNVLECHHSTPPTNVTVEDSPAQVVAALLTKLALARYSRDNISVVVVDLKRL
ncbi:hypothetical protein L7F22_025776 [Adiantum nelumboides]|nr:hypothetical protein [Adiantum nelumboides]MCO5572025.1 hypothetical protein [Adiantum nelumboides]